MQPGRFSYPAERVGRSIEGVLRLEVRRRGRDSRTIELGALQLPDRGAGEQASQAGDDQDGGGDRECLGRLRPGHGGAALRYALTSDVRDVPQVLEEPRMLRVLG